jgi:cyanophycinase-like exopeptidase
MSKREEQKTEQVGYRNPPKRKRFKPGQSGNPKGRPKGVLNMATVLERVLRENVIINGKTVNKLQAAVTQLATKAASGDLKAAQLLIALVRSAEERAIQGAIPNSVPDEVDEKVVAGILKRIETTNKGDQKNANETVAE